MTLWFVFALMTAAAIFAVLWPLSRRRPEHGGSDIAVYRDQLDEIAHDRAGGLIWPIVSSKTATTLRGGNACCAPIWCAASATRRMPAAADARRALAGDPDKLRRIDELVKGLGLQG